MDLSPDRRLMQISGHVMLARCLGIAAELGIADHLHLGPAAAAGVAAKSGSHPGALYRMLRYLAANGIFAEDDHGNFSNNDVSALLRDGVPGGMRDWLRSSWQDVSWDTYKQLPHTIATGDPAFPKAFGETFFGYLARRPDMSARFDAAMARQSAPENASIAAAYPFDRAAVVVDVGGGRGGFMAALLTRHQHLRGILFDQAHVLAQPNHVREAGLTSRCDFAAGDFFAEVAPGGDVYVLKRILHDWNDDDATRILRACAAAAGARGRIIVADAVLKPGGAPDPNKALDMSMLALLNGRERTAGEFETLFAEAGLEMIAIHPTAAPSTLSLVEARRT